MLDAILLCVKGLESGAKYREKLSLLMPNQDKTSARKVVQHRLQNHLLLSCDLLVMEAWPPIL